MHEEQEKICTNLKSHLLNFLKKKVEENHLYVPHIVKIKISLMGYNLTFFILMF